MAFVGHGIEVCRKEKGDAMRYNSATGGWKAQASRAANAQGKQPPQKGRDSNQGVNSHSAETKVGEQNNSQEAELSNQSQQRFIGAAKVHHEQL